MIGSIVGNYKITEKIGEGGMGTVYKGVDMMLEREVAIKALRPELGSQPAVVERFRSEAVTLAKLNHPNIATLYSFFRQGDHFFMVLEFVRGATLDRIINGPGSMSCEQAITMFSQVLEGIDHAHRFGVVHRDIKPGNVMLTEAGTLKVLDFGIARVLGTSRMTKAGHLIGTIEYMSPEQVRGQETDARSDIYSLGILLYEMLTGRVPFATDSEFELMKSQVEAIPPPPRGFAPHIPDAIEEATLKSLAKRPEDRFQTAGEFRAALLASGVVAATSRPHPFTSGQSYAPPSGNQAPDSASATSPSQSLPFQSSPSQPPVSHPPFSNPAISPETAKETRLATGDINFGAHATPAVASASQAKETRLGVVADVAQLSHAGVSPGYVSPSPSAPNASLLSKLNWKHYTAAGVAALLLIVVIAVPVALMLNRARKATAAAAQQPVVTQAAPEPTAQPTPAEQPTAQPDAAQAFAEVPADAAAPTPDVTRTADESTPVGRDTAVSSFAARDAKRDKPAAAKFTQPPVSSSSARDEKVDARKREEDQRRMREAAEARARSSRKAEALKALDQ